jgi:lipopolysaccharide biosynthesis regulator YciM
MKADSQMLVNLKSVRGRIDYTTFNYCATCGYKLPKEILRCPDCRQKVRTRPWHRPKIVDMKRL